MQHDWLQTFEDGEVVSIEAAARLLHVSPVTVWRMVRQGKLPAVRVGRKAVRIRKADLAAVVEPAAGDAPAPATPPPSARVLAQRSRAASRILTRRDAIGRIPASTTALIDAGRADVKRDPRSVMRDA